MFRLTRLLLLGLVLLTPVIFSGCANRAALKTVLRPTQYDPPFAFNGRMTIRQGLENSTASVRWVHNPEESEDEVIILAPFGRTIARIHRDVQGATLESQGRFYVSQDVESLTQQVLGWTLPMSYLTHWATGTPDQDSTADVERDSKKQVYLLRQGGWEVRYLRYAGTTADSLPMRFVVRNDTVEISVVIDQWDKQIR